MGDKVDFKLFVALLLFFTSIVVLNKNEFKFFANKLLKFKKIILIVIGSLHGFSNMGGSFLSLYSSLLSKNKKELTRYYISYGYLTMGIIQYLIVLIISYKSLDFSKLYYTLIAIILYCRHFLRKKSYCIHILVNPCPPVFPLRTSFKYPFVFILFVYRSPQ